MYSFSLNNDGVFRLPFFLLLLLLQNKYGETALTQAAEFGHDTVIPLLLEADAQIDAQRDDGFTPLIRASYRGQEAAVRELLKGNPNLDLKDKSGKTALDWAREKVQISSRPHTPASRRVEKNNYQSIVDLLVNHERS